MSLCDDRCLVCAAREHKDQKDFLAAGWTKSPVPPEASWTPSPHETYHLPSKF